LYHKIFQKEKEKNRIIKIKTHNPKRAVKEAKYKYQKKKKMRSNTSMILFGE
jgi:hypothetical protein